MVPNGANKCPNGAQKGPKVSRMDQLSGNSYSLNETDASKHLLKFWRQFFRATPLCLFVIWAQPARAWGRGQRNTANK